MTSGRLKEYCDAEFENIQAVVEELFAVVRPGKTVYSVAEMAAVATFLHNVYNGIENVLKRILSGRNVKLQNVPTWHRDLLKAAADLGILSSELHDTLLSYLSFRHFFVHAYSFTLRWEELEPLTKDVGGMVAAFKSSVLNYLDKLD